MTRDEVKQRDGSFVSLFTKVRQKNRPLVSIVSLKERSTNSAQLPGKIS